MVDCHFLLQGIFLSQRSTQVPRNACQFFTIWATRETYCMHGRLLLYCLTLCDPMDCSPPDHYHEFIRLQLVLPANLQLKYWEWENRFFIWSTVGWAYSFLSSLRRRNTISQIALKVSSPLSVFAKKVTSLTLSSTKNISLHKDLQT